MCDKYDISCRRAPILALRVARYRPPTERTVLTWPESTPRHRPERARVARARRLPERGRGPLPRRGAGPALPRRRVRADRREGHDRLHDPRGHRAVEAVPPRLLRVLRRQGRTGARAVRGDSPRGARRHHSGPSTSRPIRSDASACSRSAPPLVRPGRRAAQTRARTTAGPSPRSSMHLAVEHADRVRAALAPLSRHAARAHRRRRPRPARSASPTHAARPHSCSRP